jgi:hypothetical protein
VVTAGDSPWLDAITVSGERRPHLFVAPPPPSRMKAAQIRLAIGQVSRTMEIEIDGVVGTNHRALK